MALSFSFTTNAGLSTISDNEIQGSEPYIERDGVKVEDLSHLLSIKIDGDTYISDESGNMKKDNGDGTYTDVSIITLSNKEDKFNSVSTLVPADAESHALDDPAIIPLEARKDDNGDGGFTITGNLKGEWTDRVGNSIGSNLTGKPEICLAPYTLTLTTTDNPEISTQYGYPHKKTYGNSSAKFKINPAEQPAACSAKPDMTYNTSQYWGPPSMWDKDKGFLVQTNDPDHYDKNFPTTGGHGLFFTLEVGGVDATKLKWGDATVAGANGSVQVGNIYARMTDITPTTVKVTLGGPMPTQLQIEKENSPDVPTPTILPAKIVLEGKNSDGSVAVSYGFVIQKWFITRGSWTMKGGTAELTHYTWCKRAGYQIVSVADLTSATGTTTGGTVNEIPPVLYPNQNTGQWDPGSNYWRHIGGGLSSEWGNMGTYTAGRWSGSQTWTSEIVADGKQLAVKTDRGIVYTSPQQYALNVGVCRLPLTD